MFILSTDPDAANGNTADVNKTVTPKEDVNKNEKTVKPAKNTNKKSANKLAKSETNAKGTDSYENGKDETDKVVNIDKQPLDEQENEPEKPAPVDNANKSPIFVPKYKYSEGMSCPLFSL